MEIKVKGLVAAVFTPLDDKNVVNLTAIESYGKYLADQDVKAVLVNGTAGEGTSLTFEERKAVLEEWISVSKITKQDIIVQIGGTSLKQVKNLAAHAEHLKVGGILCLPELFYKPKSVEELIRYMKDVGDSAPCTPLLYYHIPVFSGVYLDMNKFLEIGSQEIPTLAGIKFSHTVLGDAVKCLSAQGGKFTFYHGYDQIFSAAFMMGIENAMITSLNHDSKTVYNILEHVKNGRNKEALNLERKLMTLNRIVLSTTSWIAGFKAITSMKSGLNLGMTRPPVTPLNETQYRKLRDELKTKEYEYSK